ncbi:hypothetical protein W02_10920 [Nitrospira sp. KM1]|nr:hypothetical protein W02_10920 [Nitrospira sp. KM1]
MHWVGWDGTILWANKAELTMLGYSSAEYIGHHIQEFHADQPLIEDMLARLQAGETVHNCEAKLRRKDGALLYVLISSNVLMERGKFVHTRCFTRDITHYKKDEEARGRLAAIVESSDDAIISRDSRGIVTSWNIGAERLFGYTAEEMIGQSMSRLIPEDLRDAESRILSGKLLEHYETIRRRKDGSHLHISLTVSPIRGRLNRVVGSSIIARDITGRKQAEVAIRNSELQLKAELADTNLLHAISAILIQEDNVQALYEKILDAAVGVTHADFASLQMYHLQPGLQGSLQLLGYRGFTPQAAKRWESISPEDQPVCSRVLQTGKRCIIPDIGQILLPDELRNTYRETGIRSVQTTPLFSRNGQLVGMISTHWKEAHAPSERALRLLDILARQAADLIERKQGEVALREMNDDLELRVNVRTQELMQSQQQLRALASELNLTEQKERKRLAGELHDYLGQLLALSRIKLSQTRQQPMSPMLAKIIADVQESIDKSIAYTRTLVSQLSPPVLHEFGLAMALEWLAQDMPKRNLQVALDIRADPSWLPEDQALLLFQCVRELLFNCVKHAQVKDAGILLEQREGMLHIAISDRGVGFDSTRTASEERVTNSAGHGFGLFSIRERMLSLGGRFDLQSDPGNGTVATLVLPITTGKSHGAVGTHQVSAPLEQQVPVSDSEERPISKREDRLLANGSGSDRPPIRVLLVDDHAMVRKGLSSLLEAYPDVRVIGEAANGEDAVLLASQLLPDVILMDVTMPKMDGIEATRQIKRKHSEVVVIGLSVHDAEPVQTAMRAAGAVSLLSKETAVDYLYEMILTGMQAKASASIRN